MLGHVEHIAEHITGYHMHYSRWLLNVASVKLNYGGKVLGSCRVVIAHSRSVDSYVVGGLRFDSQ